MGNPSLIIPTKDIGIKDNLSYEEIPIQILDRQVRKLRTKEVASVKVLWRNQFVEEATWDAEEDMKKRYPHPSNPEKFQIKATLSSDMVDREIGMDPREGTSHSPLGQRYRFPLEAQGGSPITLVPASPARIEARRDAVPSTSPVPLVHEEAIDTGPPVPVVSPLEISGEQGMREAVQLLTRMVSIHERQLESEVDIQRDRLESSKVQEFLHLAPPLFTGSSLIEDPQDFIDHIYRVLRVMHASVTKVVKLDYFRLRDVAIL
ncbi:hypothetical protein MTR67_012531 [Solanum verrucosum]|uniref:Chromo domain-containing protein n=1 Tax=Solanum verrucosum TaxID=315347 RepID=A0AAF0TH36_SOLVR|nr:hypothetical protein MTR67_012531 [Solanum verrucosum]